MRTRINQWEPGKKSFDKLVELMLRLDRPDVLVAQALQNVNDGGHKTSTYLQDGQQDDQGSVAVQGNPNSCGSLWRAIHLLGIYGLGPVVYVVEFSDGCVFTNSCPQKT